LNLGAKIAAGFLLGVIAAVAVLFIPAGTLKFWQAWAYIAVFFLPILTTYLFFLKHDPQMLARRLKSEEQVVEQKLLMRSARLLSIALFMLPGFDFRFGWSRGLLGTQPMWLTWFSLSMAMAGILAALWVMNMNRFAGATIGVEAGQRVISTGPYSIVRHPMYAAGMVLWLFTPLAMASPISLPAFALVIQRRKSPLRAASRLLRLLSAHPLPVDSLRLVKLRQPARELR